MVKNIIILDLYYFWSRSTSFVDNSVLHGSAERWSVGWGTHGEGRGGNVDAAREMILVVQIQRWEELLFRREPRVRVCYVMRERSDSCGMDTPSSSFWFLPGGAGCCSCLCIPLRRQQRQQQQQQHQRHASPAQQPLATASPNSTAATSMVQMFYYENRGKCCKKLLRYNGYPNKVRSLHVVDRKYLHG